MGADAMKVERNSLVEEVWIHHPLGVTVGAHADGEQMGKGGNNIFRCINFDMPKDVSGTRSNSCIIIGAGNGPIDNVIFENNWCNGGNFAMYLGESKHNYGCTTNVQAKNNRFGRKYLYGLLSTSCSTYSCGNVWDDYGPSDVGASGHDPNS